LQDVETRLDIVLLIETRSPRSKLVQEPAERAGSPRWHP
jgi:hypothetical protein